jgi:hypothetical protein
VLDLGEGHRQHTARQVEKIENAIAILFAGGKAHKAGERQITRQGIATQPSEDHLFVGGGHDLLPRIVARSAERMSKKVREE